MLDSAQKKFLKGLAHNLKPLVLVGKGGLNDAVQDEISKVLESHELVKIKFNDFKDERKKISSEVAEVLEAELVQVIGNIAVIYKASSKTENRKIKLPLKKEKVSLSG